MSNAAGGCSLQMHACSWPFTCNSPSARDGESFSTFAECRYLLSAEGVKQRKAGERYDGMRKWCELEHWIASPSERLHEPADGIPAARTGGDLHAENAGTTREVAHGQQGAGASKRKRCWRPPVWVRRRVRLCPFMGRRLAGC